MAAHTDEAKHPKQTLCYINIAQTLYLKQNSKISWDVIRHLDSARPVFEAESDTTRPTESAPWITCEGSHCWAARLNLPQWNLNFEASLVGFLKLILYWLVGCSSAEVQKLQHTFAA